MYDVNVIIFIRDSFIQIGDLQADEIVRYIIDSELIYHQNHSILIYPKIIIVKQTLFPSKITKADDENNFSDSSFEDSFSDVKDSKDF